MYNAIKTIAGIFGNPISSPGWWKASTFGGKTGFNIAKTTNLQASIFVLKILLIVKFFRGNGEICGNLTSTNF